MEKFNIEITKNNKLMEKLLDAQARYEDKRKDQDKWMLFVDGLDYVDLLTKSLSEQVSDKLANMIENENPVTLSHLFEGGTHELRFSFQRYGSYRHRASVVRNGAAVTSPEIEQGRSGG